MFLCSFLSSHYVMTYKQLVGSRLILDVGCGSGLPMRCLRRLGLVSRVVGVDVFVSYLHNVKRLGIYSNCVVASAEFLPFRERSFDSLICLQVIEHLDRRGGFAALRELSRVADKVIVTAPVGSVEADVDQWNPFQRHRSGWYPEDLRRLGYDVRGFGWFRILRLSRLAPLFVMFNLVLALALRQAPRLAYHMYAVKTHQLLR